MQKTMNKNKLLSLFLILLMLPLFAGFNVQPVSAAESTFTTTSAFGDYFKIWAINGTINDATPALVWNTTAEYYEFTVTITPNAANSFIMEFGVPAGYMGTDIWEGSTLKTGTANYTLSVDYACNEAGTPVPAKDWNTLSLANGTGNDGIWNRVQLASNRTAETTLTVRVYYATAPAVGFDGVNDWVEGGAALGTTTTYYYASHFRMQRAPRDDFACIVAGMSGTDSNRLLIRKAVAQVLIQHVNTTGTVSIYISNSWSFGTAQKIDVSYNGTQINVFRDGVLIGASPYAVGDIVTSDKKYEVGMTKAVNYPVCMAMYGVEVYDSSDRSNSFLFLNASSFSGTSNITVTDFSGSGNHGTAYGGVQYKVYTGTGFQFTVEDNAAPTYTTIGSNATHVGTACLAYVEWADETALSGYIFSTNNTGAWVNATWVAMTGTGNWSNATFTLNTTVQVVQWNIYANDSGGNWNATSVQSITTELFTAVIDHFTLTSTTAFSTAPYSGNNGTWNAGTGELIFSTGGNVTINSSQGWWMPYAAVSSAGGAITNSTYASDFITMTGIAAGGSITVTFTLPAGGGGGGGGGGGTGGGTGGAEMVTPIPWWLPYLAVAIAVGVCFWSIRRSKKEAKKWKRGDDKPTKWGKAKDKNVSWDPTIVFE